MSRHFTATAGDYVDLDPGSAASVDGGPSTIMVLWRPTTVGEGWLVDAENASGNHAFSINPYLDGYLYHTMVGFRTTMAYTSSDGWRLDAWTKPSGTGQVRGHRMLLSGGGWTHADYGTSDDSTNIPTVRFRIGRHYALAGALDGDVAAAAVVGADWADAVFETGSLDTGLAAWLAAVGSDPAAVWSFGQASTSDPVVDVTGGGADQSGISGTSIGDDPAGFSYLISTPTVVAVTLPAMVARCSTGPVVPAPVMVGSAVPRVLIGSAVVV